MSLVSTLLVPQHRRKSAVVWGTYVRVASWSGMNPPISGRGPHWQAELVVKRVAMMRSRARSRKLEMRMVLRSVVEEVGFEV
jgi:hypothetical protein